MHRVIIYSGEKSTANLLGFGWIVQFTDTGKKDVVIIQMIYFFTLWSQTLTHVTDSYWTTYCTENHSFSRIHWFFIKIIYKNEIFCKHLLCAKHCAKHLVWSAFGSYCLFFCQESLSGNSLILVKSEHMTESETTKVLPWDFSARPWKEGKFFLLWETILWHIQRLKK